MSCARLQLSASTVAVGSLWYEKQGVHSPGTELVNLPGKLPKKRLVFRKVAQIAALLGVHRNHRTAERSPAGYNTLEEDFPIEKSRSRGSGTWHASPN